MNISIFYYRPFTSIFALFQRNVLVLFGFLFIAFTAASQNGADDPTFNTPTGPYGLPRTLALQSDGKVIVGGQFTYYAGVIRSNLARLNSDGTLDNTFTTGSGFSYSSTAIVLSVAVQPDGKILAGGFFTNYNGTAANYLVRLNANGTVDPTFTSSMTYPVYSLALQPDGKVIAGGGYPNGYKRLNSNGSADTGFTPYTISNSGSITSIIVQPDGKILLGGNFSFGTGGGQDNNILRLNSDGTRDMSFAASSDEVNKIILLSDGKLLVATATHVLRLNSNGTASGGFTMVTTNGSVTGLEQQADGRLVLSGNFTTVNSTARKRIARVSAAGGLDPTFGLDGFDNGATVSLQLSDGRIVFGGNFLSYASTSAQYLVCTNADGTIAHAGNTAAGVNLAILSSSRQSDGRIIVGGEFTSLNSVSLNRVGRLMPNGRHDPTFAPGTGANNRVKATAVQGDGKILFGGEFTSYNGTARNRLVRVSNTGILDAAFNIGTGANDAVNAIAVQPDGNILVGGNFTQYNGTTVARFIRLTAAGALDIAFNTALGTGFTGGAINAIVLQPDGKILVSGGFNFVNGAFRPRIVRLNTDGSVDASFVPPSGYGNISIDCMVLQPDGKIIVGGNFQSLYNTTDQRLARLNPNGTADATFMPAAYPDSYIYNYPYSLALQPNGKIIVGANSLSRVNADGTNDETFLNNNGGSSFSVRTMIMMPQGATLAFGTLFIAPDFKAGTARLKTAEAITTTQTVTSCGPFTWINGATYNTSITGPTVSLTTVNGLDSIVSLNLTVLQPTSSTVTITSCNYYEWPQNGLIYMTSGQYTDTVLNTAGCDSIITLNLTIPPATSSDLYITSCTSYTWPQTDETYIISGSYMDTIPNAAGCDSIIVLHLTIVPATFGTVDVTSCTSYIWPLNGQTYTTSGQYTDTIPGGTGCDSIVTLNLTIIPATFGMVDITSCTSYIWPLSGQTYMTSGQYTDTIPGGTGCDSIVTLNLTIIPATFGMIDITSCTSYIWPLNGQTYTTSGQYTDTIPNGAGCDSIVTLNLLITPSSATDLMSFSIPSDDNDCTGAISITLSGNGPFTVLDDGVQAVTTSGTTLLQDLCPGIHDLAVIGSCSNDTTHFSVVVPLASNYIFNDPFADSLAVDSLGATVVDCNIFFNSIDSAAIYNMLLNGNVITVVWNIIDTEGSYYDTVSYALNNGSGVYWLQLAIYCPAKALGEYFAVTQAVYFNNGEVTTGFKDLQLTDDVRLYPNPAATTVTVDFPGEPRTLVIRDAIGKFLSECMIYPGALITLEQLPAGIYLFEFSSEAGSLLKRVEKI